MNWRCAASSAASLLCACALGAAAQEISRGPYIVDVSSISARVCWRQDGGDDDYCRAIADIPAGAAFRYELPGVKNAWAGKTLSPFWEPVRFAAFGDAGDGSAAQRSVARVLRAVDPQFVLLTGDVALPAGTQSQYESNYFGVYGELLPHVGFFPAVGERDYGDAWLASSGRRRFADGYARVFHRPKYYSFDAGPVHFASVDTNQAGHVGGAEPIGPGSPQLTWLAKDLEGSLAPWKVVIMHAPLYSTESGHGDDAWLRSTLQPLLEKEGVSVALAGRDRLYQRTKPIRGVTYVTVGTGGAPLARGGKAADWLAREVSAHGLLVVEASTAAFTATFIDDSGRPRDRFSLTAHP